MGSTSTRRVLAVAFGLAVSGVTLVPTALAQVPGCETAGSADPSGIAESWKVCEAVENFRWCQQWGQDQIEDVVGEWSDWARQQVDQARDLAQEQRCKVARQLNHPPDVEEPTAETEDPRIGEAATYCTTATDSDEEQTLWVRFKFVNPGIRSSTSAWKEAEDGRTVCETWSWDPHEDRMRIRAQARDKFDSSDWSSPRYQHVETRPPDAPSISGPGFVWDTELSGAYRNYPTYCAEASDPDGDRVEVTFDYTSRWLDPDATGEVCETAKVSWSAGTATVEATARDEHEAYRSSSIDVTVGDNHPPYAGYPSGPSRPSPGTSATYCTDTWDRNSGDDVTRWGISFNDRDGEAGDHWSGWNDATWGEAEYCYEHTFESDEWGDYYVLGWARDTRSGMGISDGREIHVSPPGWSDCGSGNDAAEWSSGALEIDPPTTCAPPSDGDCVTTPAGTCLDHERRPSWDDGEDQDVYRFTAGAGDTIEIDVDACDSSPQHEMTVVLTDPENHVWFLYPSDECRVEDTWTDDKSGRYILRVEGVDGDGGEAVIPYSMTIEVV